MSNLTGDWDRLDRFLREAPQRIRVAGEIGGNRAGALLAKRIKEGIRSQAPGGRRFMPISALTAQTRSGGGTKALIASGELLRGITWKKVSGGVWVGANRKDDSGAYNLAAIHEFGTTIQVTERMRRAFIGVMGRQIRKETRYIHIPARPFIGSVISDPDVRQELKDEYIHAIREVLRP